MIDRNVRSDGMWDERTNRRVAKVASRQLETIDDVIEMLCLMEPALEGLDDESGANPVTAFNSLYLQITRDVKQNLIDGTYRDSCFMEILDVEFARLYFEALKNWCDGNVVPVSWALLFRLEDGGERHTDFEGALLGVNAHVNRDLTYALIVANAKAGQIDDVRDRRRDFNKINHIFRDRLDPISNRLIDSLPSKPWKCIWRILDIAFGDFDEWLMHRTIVEGRDRAWKRAACLWSIPDSDAAPEYPGRSQLAARLARLVLGSHIFDEGFLAFLGPGEFSPSEPVTQVQSDLVEALPNAGELLFGSDLLEMTSAGTRVAVKAKDADIVGSWEGQHDELASLFADDWLLRTIDESECDVEVEQLKQCVHVLREQQELFTTS